MSFPDSPSLEDVLERAASAARNSGNLLVGTEHLLLAVLSGPSGVDTLFRDAGQDPESLRRALQPPPSRSFHSARLPQQVSLTANAKSCIQAARSRMIGQRSRSLAPEDLLIAIIEQDSVAKQRWNRVAE